MGGLKISRYQIFDRTLTSFQNFFRSEVLSGTLLITCGLAALVIANSPLDPSYQNVFRCVIAPQFTILNAVNQGLMALFFLAVGLEIRRELTSGELQGWSKARPPVFAAAGGMIAPAIIYLAFNWHHPHQNGWGIPIATDIALSLGVLNFAAPKIDLTERVFLTALAIADDLGAVIVIGLFYSPFHFRDALIGLIFFGLIFVAGISKTTSLIVPFLAGIITWFGFRWIGIEPSLAGVATAFFISNQPAKNNEMSLSDRVENVLVPLTSFVIIPVFVFANAGIKLQNPFSSPFALHLSLGIIFGLVVGKPIGILLGSRLAQKTHETVKVGQIPNRNRIGIACLGGIGLIMSLFVANLAIQDQPALATAKLSILVGSVASGILGTIILKTNREKI